MESVTTQALSSCGERGAAFLWGFSLCWLLLLWSAEFRALSLRSCCLRVLEDRLSSCGTWAWLLCNMWTLPGPGIESVSPAWAGRFLSTAPPGKFKTIFILIRMYIFQTENATGAFSVIFFKHTSC